MADPFVKAQLHTFGVFRHDLSTRATLAEKVFFGKSFRGKRSCSELKRPTGVGSSETGNRMVESEDKPPEQKPTPNQRAIEDLHGTFHF